MKWTDAKNNPPTTQRNKYGQYISKRLVIRVDGVDGWQTGYYYESPEDSYAWWVIEGFHGDFVVTEWMNPEEPTQ